MTLEQQQYQQQYQIPQQQYLDPGVAPGASQGSGLIQKVKEGIHDHHQTHVLYTCPTLK